MKCLVLIIVTLAGFPSPSAAQRGGFHGGGVPVARFSANFGLPRIAPIPQLGPIRAFDGFKPGFRRDGRLLNGGAAFEFPWAFDSGAMPDYYGQDYGPTFVMPYIAPPSLRIPEPGPAQSVLHEYNWPESGSNQAATFTIVAQDGSTRTAVAVWTQGNMMHFVTPEGRFASLLLSSINRVRTKQVNEEKHLLLPLPANNDATITR